MKPEPGRAVLGRFAEVLLRTPKYAVLAAGLARDDRLSASQKAGAVAALGYAVLPFDLLPGIIPVVGQLDDLTVLVGGLRAVLRSCPRDVALEHLSRAGLSFAVLDADLDAIRGTAWWLGRQGARLLGRAIGLSERLFRGAARAASRLSSGDDVR